MAETNNRLKNLKLLTQLDSLQHLSIYKYFQQIFIIFNLLHS